MEKAFNKINDLIGIRMLLIVILVITGGLQFFIMLGNVKEDTYKVQVSQLATETIRAPKTVEDRVKTEEERQKAANSVLPVYQFDEEAASNRAALVVSFFDYVIEAKKATTNEKEQLKSLRKKIDVFDEEQFAISFTDDQLTLLLAQSEEDLQYARDRLSAQVEEYLQKSIRQETVTQSKNEFESKVRLQLGYNEAMMNIIVMVGRASIVETEVMNRVLTEDRIAQVKEAVEPTKILQGQVIVQEGQVIDREVYRQLELLGILNNTASRKPIAGLILLTILQFSFLFVAFNSWKTTNRNKRNALLVTAIVYVVSVVIMKLLSVAAENFEVFIAFLYPTALATMLIRLLANERLAFLITVLLASTAGILFHDGYSSVLQMDAALYIITGGLASLFFVQSLQKRSNILQASSIVAIINVCFIGFYLLMTQSDYSLSEWLFYIGAAIISGLMSGALTIGLVPFFESAFGLLSTLRLIELSNPNHPLLKKLLVETPGTYHHSVMVANLAEAACEAVGADGLLARVGCYYHDIGKTKRPQFFIENQMGIMNPHDVLPPEQSAKIIISHTIDGAELLAQYKMPQEIIDLALQHHGTSLLKFFFHKAKESGGEVNESAFRYPGPRPKTREAAIISIADSVEAAVRSMKEPTPEKIQKLVDAIVSDKLADHQFDDCELSIKELKIVQRVICETLNGIFHSRIEYPKFDEKE